MGWGIKTSMPWVIGHEHIKFKREVGTGDLEVIITHRILSQRDRLQLWGLGIVLDKKVWT